MRRVRAGILLLPWTLGLALGPLAERGAASPSAYDVVSSLAGLGPRPQGSPAREKAAGLLMDAMRRAGLQQVRAVPASSDPSLVDLEGVLPGKSDQEIVLSGHYDTVPESPGADDDGSGCAVAIAAAADLARTPLDHSVRVVLFDGEEKGLFGSRAWVAALDAPHRDRILADLNLEMLGWPGSPGPTLHALPVRRRLPGDAKRATGPVVLPPGWLVHALLRSGEAVGWPLAIADPRFPTLMQLLQRSVRVRFGADGDSFLAAGIPAATLSDSSFLSLDPTYHKPADTAARLDPNRMEKWTAAVAATVRRLDRLAGRPIPEDQYLVLAGRVWLRRDLLLIGFLLWGVLVFRGIPGRWRDTSAEERARQRSRYMPGFVFRLLLLCALFAAPVLAVLLWPAAALALAPPRRPGLRVLWIVLGLLPLLVFCLTVAGGIAVHVATLRGGFQGGWPAALLLLAAFVSYAVMIAGRRRYPYAES